MGTRLICLMFCLIEGEGVGVVKRFQLGREVRGSRCGRRKLGRECEGAVCWVLEVSDEDYFMDC
jgi:hypothetical protein